MDFILVREEPIMGQFKWIEVAPKMISRRVIQI